MRATLQSFATALGSIKFHIESGSARSVRSKVPLPAVAGHPSFLGLVARQALGQRRRPDARAPHKQPVRYFLAIAAANEVQSPDVSNELMPAVH
jgi:hypothetical protein